MITAKGKSILKGIAIGKIKFLAKKQAEIKENAADPAAELKRYEDARALASEQLQALYDKAVVEAGEEHAAIFEIHMMMLEDDDYVEAITELINSDGKTAEFAVKTTGENFAETFASMDDEYMKARAADVRDISGRMVNILTGADTGPADSDEPFIIVAEDLAPSETVQLDKSKLLGFVTRLGSTNSHTAILARNMNIPALIGTEISEDWDGRMAIIDGYNSCLYIDPTEELLRTLDEKRVHDLEQRAMLQALKGKPNVTLDGREINVYANIGNVSDVGMVLENDAGGIGLFRSEFIYLHSPTFPLRDMIPSTKLESYMEDHTIEIAPLAFMRGRTLDHAFVILDEAQNATRSQLKMFLTRMGRSAKFIVTGDITQIDLPPKTPSGLPQAMEVLKDVKGIEFIYLDDKDVVRHKLVTDIINAYKKHHDEEESTEQLNN